MSIRTHASLLLAFSICAFAQRDPGVRPGTPDAGVPLPGLTAAELAAFEKGKQVFLEVEAVADGLGPRFNLDSCGGCHAQPATGGVSPDINPQIAAASFRGAHNAIPPFLSPNGPVRVVRFKRRQDGTPDGGVHSLFTITGRDDAGACTVPPEDFSNNANLSFRIPTPVFGLGLIESIPDAALVQNLAANAQAKRQLGIRGTLNTNGNDGTVTRLGWKAQNKSAMIFSGEAYNVEMGITNELFPNDRYESPQCAPVNNPDDRSDVATGGYSDVTMLTVFMRLLDQPHAGAQTRSTQNGSQLFAQIGCALCHTPALRTGISSTAALSNRTVNLFSDLALHDMGVGLADDISQVNATGQQFRTAPLWGLGKRKFLLHDGRSTDLGDTIEAHFSNGSEANGVVGAYRALPPQAKQDLLNFLRSI